MGVVNEESTEASQPINMLVVFRRLLGRAIIFIHLHVIIISSIHFCLYFILFVIIVNLILFIIYLCVDILLED